MFASSCAGNFPRVTILLACRHPDGRPGVFPRHSSHATATELPGTFWLAIGDQFLAAKYQRISDTTTLITIMVVIGKNNLNPGRSITMSPGSLKNGRADSCRQNIPTSTMTMPMTMSARFMRRA